MTRRISITGIDGTGKTTIVRRLAAAHDPGALRAFRAPQYHEDPDLPFGALSADIDRLSVLADSRGDALLKATALFLSMTLYGDVERHLESAYAPRLLVGERQCLADSLTYARYYFPMLQGDLKREALEPAIREAIGDEGFGRVQAWQAVMHRRLPAVPAVPFWQLPGFIKQVFSAEPRSLVATLEALYHARLPDQIVVLTVSPEALAGRLAAKHGGGEAPKELHEQAHVLAMFQQGLTESCGLLYDITHDLRITVIDTSTQTPEETEAAVLQAIETEEARATRG